MPVQFPAGYALAQLTRSHPRERFDSGVSEVNEWLKTKARQAQKKHLSVTRVLLNEEKAIAGFYTLAIGQINLDSLPARFARGLPRTMLPIVTLAWLGVDSKQQGKGLGRRLLASALGDCFQTGQQVPFVAVVLDCLNERAKRFYQRFDFQELPGHPMKLFLPWTLLEKMMETEGVDTQG